MFFSRRKNKNKPIPSPTSEEFIYYLRQDKGTDGVLLALSHSSEPPMHENADRDDFTSISREVLEQIFSDYWVSAWVWDRTYVFPGGKRGKEKTCFAQVFQQCARRSEIPPSLLACEDGKIAFFSHGFSSPFFSFYMSDTFEGLLDREMYLYGYKQPFEPSGNYNEETRRQELLPWDIQVFFDELHDNLLIFVKDQHEAVRISSLTRQVCDKYGKKLRLVCDDGAG